MKKLIVLLLALLVATSAFAQLTINGYSRANALYTNSSGVESLAYRMRFNLTFNDASGNFGAWGRFQSDAYAAPAFKYGYGWAKFLGGVVKVNAGQLANYDYMVGSGKSDFKLGNVCTDAYIGDATDGYLVQVMPNKALNVGVTVLPSGTLSGADLTLSAKYSIDKVGNLMVNVRAPDPTPTATTDLFASGAFEFTGMPGLDATAAFEFGGTGFWHGYAANQMTAIAVVTYTSGPFGVQVAPVYNVTGSKLYCEGFVSYALQPTLILNVVGAYDQAHAAAMLPTAGATYFVGAELNVKGMGAGYFMTGVWYDDVGGLSIPLALRVNF